MAAAARAPAVAGRFYSSDAAELRDEVRGYLDAANPPPLDGPLIGVVVPHAGVMYSGPVAAYSYRALAHESWDAVILVGGSHHYHLPNAHVFARGSWESPLGEFPVDETLAAELIDAHELIVDDPVPHLPEHSLELQLPFLAETLGTVPIVPVLVSPAAPAACAALGAAVGGLARDRKLALIASTDLSHYHPYTLARERDRAAIDAVCAWDPAALARGCVDQSVELCGGGAVAAVELAAAQRGASHAVLLNHATSGDVPAGPRDRVVGYASIAFLGDAEGELEALSDEQRLRLLGLARETLHACVLQEPLPAVPADDARLRASQGVFVTLRRATGELRGCLGQAENPASLASGVVRYTVAAATRDPRFPAITAEELADLRVEVSVLGPLMRAPDARAIDVGTHGIVIRRGERAGILLPQVAPAQGWGREALLQAAAQKAGLPRDAWRWEGTELYRFTADVFGEAPGL